MLKNLQRLKKVRTFEYNLKPTEMKKYNVVIELVRGYYPENEQGESDPIIERKEFIVEAENEDKAIEEAKKLETSMFSVFDSYAEEII